MNDNVVCDWRFNAEVWLWEMAHMQPADCSEREFWSLLAAEVSARAAELGMAVPRRSLSKDEARHDLASLVRAGSEISSQDWLAGRWGVSKGSVSRWLSEWESAGTLSRPRAGRIRSVRPI